MGQRVCRYRAGLTYQHVFMKNKTDASREAVGRCTLPPPDPQLKGAWFQTLTLEHQSWFQNVPLKFNLRRYKGALLAILEDHGLSRGSDAAAIVGDKYYKLN
jgi:hypothetical protein